MLPNPVPHLQPVNPCRQPGIVNTQILPSTGLFVVFDRRGLLPSSSNHDPSSGAQTYAEVPYYGKCLSLRPPREPQQD